MAPSTSESFIDISVLLKGLGLTKFNSGEGFVVVVVLLPLPPVTVLQRFVLLSTNIINGFVTGLGAENGLGDFGDGIAGGNGFVPAKKLLGKPRLPFD
jgi:hypothetical protein